MVRKLGAEMVGTFILVFFAVGVATLMFGFKFDGGSAAAGVVATALCFGLVLMSLAYVLGPISGCHVNPAVTLGAVVAGRMEPLEGLFYWIAQFIGGILGALVALGDVQRLAALQPVQDRPGRGRLRLRLGHPHQRLGRLPGRGHPHRTVRLRRHRGDQQDRQPHHRGTGDRPDPHGLPPDRHPDHRHLGEPGPEPRAGPHRGWHGTHQVWLFIVAPLVGGLVGAMLHRMLFPADVARRPRPDPASLRRRARRRRVQ